MGYQVGNHCYATKQEAENVYFSLVAPVIYTSGQTTSTINNPNIPRPPVTTTNKATLIKPEYVNGKWTLQGQVINLNLAQCEPSENFKNGMELGWLIAGLMASMWLFMLVKRLLR